MMLSEKEKPPHFRLGARREGMNPQPQPEVWGAVGCNRGRVAEHRTNYAVAL